MAQLRLNKFISSNSKYSRRKADELIEKGKVFVNNKKIEKQGTKIDTEKDKVKINGEEISAESKKTYLALNKPTNYITTRKDEKNRTTVMDLTPKIPNLKPIGRLDKDTEGLLLLSNDGEFINRYTHPRFNCEKEYFVKINGTLTETNKEKLEKGIIIDNKKTAPAKIKVIKRSRLQTTLTITIHEGRNRQIRKMFARVNNDVKYLKRIRIGKISLGQLKKGKYRRLTTAEINAN